RKSELSWTPYVGWESVKNYLVYRRHSNKPFELLDSLNGETLTYTDSLVCDELYEYRVVATHNAENYRSASNKVQHQIEYVFQETPLNIELATIDSLNRVFLKWNHSVQRNVLHYSIDRTEAFKPWKLNHLSTKDTWAVDSNVWVNNKWYAYRISVVDACNNKSETGRIGKTIYLQHRFILNHPELFWTHYRDWEAGVAQYEVYRSGANESDFSSIAKLDANDTSLLDTGAFRLYKQPFNYQVKAIENGAFGDTSVSNIILVEPVPTAFAPSAFSPNNDGVNDEFLIKGWALKEAQDLSGFRLQVFNRWGQMIYESTDVDKGWDGTFNGTECPVGVYIYLAQIAGTNGEVFFLKGNVTLVK
ncbi:MAG: gliding motility-associated C-terminal domain-containing protein, partial [Bacteroidetes bacterium]|nr:gliding motility-associated C-terminal domain-containing protein [Bacteroidota bacterium]